jgi:hypothetical protein
VIPAASYLACSTVGPWASFWEPKLRLWAIRRDHRYTVLALIWIVLAALVLGLPCGADGRERNCGHGCACCAAPLWKAKPRTHRFDDRSMPL